MTTLDTRVYLTLTPNQQAAAKQAHGVSSKVTKIDKVYWDILAAAAKGERVDALDLNIACHAAMLTCATRGSQSPSRRDLAAQVWIVVSAVQMALERHTEERPNPRALTADALEGWLDG